MPWDLNGKSPVTPTATTDDPNEARQLMVDREGNALLRGILDQLLIANAYEASKKGSPITLHEAYKYLG